MSDFNPNEDMDTQEQADLYLNWCADNFMRLSQGGHTYRTGIRCAAWLFVVSVSQLHLDEEVETEREALLKQLGNYAAIARALERQAQHFTIERLIVLRSSLDCWEPVGQWAENLLTASKAAVSALMLIELHPLIDLWELPCPDVWGLLDAATQTLAEINLGEPLTFEDYAVRPSESVTARYTWQRVNNMVRHLGSPPMSQN